ncbi:multidrug ABC superfamily ATP binding cassette transporter, permease protein [Liquorilactobacillus satsumensis DSM 16230 = JCM 12392]|uniref:Multidrug ABC superfamily ATP binding cassette transporter, permease protein n=2 Tax=Liquorilactobacillus satsumensis TaxID=259059 RepID=A0A0R1V4Q1_9LACO|nr:multidrug ABC superfamily ATP binding cassette transporter, permease protein [Liquorilactobacillus satsumensis DSM 16230 = JCM 12392]
MAKRVITEMLRDRRTLALMFLAPLVILSLFYFLFQSNKQQTTSLAVRNVDDALVQELKGKHLKIHKVTADKDAQTLIKKYNYAGFLTQNGNKLTLTLQNSDQSKTARIKQSFQSAQIKLRAAETKRQLKKQAIMIQRLQQQLNVNHPQSQTSSSNQTKSAQYQLKTNYLYGSSSSTFFETLLPIMIGFVVFFFVFLISGISLLRERTSGTLERLLATPVRRSELIGGYLLGFGIFALCQTVVIVLFSIFVFKVQILGSLWNVLLVNILLAFVALALGLFVSSFASSEFQMVQFIPLIVIPQIFFSGIIPVAQMSAPLRMFAHLMPLYYGGQSLANVVEKGVSFAQIAPNLGILLIFVVIFLVLNQLALRKYRQI